MTLCVIVTRLVLKYCFDKLYLRSHLQGLRVFRVSEFYFRSRFCLLFQLFRRNNVSQQVSFGRAVQQPRAFS